MRPIQRVIGITLNYLSFFEVIAHTSATTDVILLNTAPIFVTVAASILFKERFIRNKGLSLAAYELYVKALSHIEAGHPSTLCMAKPAVTAVLAYAILGERMETM